MRLLTVAIAFTLASAVSAADAAAPARQPGTADPHPSEQQGGRDIKGYGYGEQPGQESGSSATQAADPARARSSAPQDERSASAAPAARGRAIVGRVLQATPQHVSIRAADDRVHRLGLDARTKVLRGGEQVTASDLREGEEVRAAFETRRKRRVATTITLVEGAGAQPPGSTDRARESGRRQAGEPPEKR